MVRLVTLVFTTLEALASCSCPSTCINAGTTVLLVRKTGDFGAVGDRLTFRFQTETGEMQTPCTMPSTGAADCVDTGMMARVVDSAGGRLRSIELVVSITPARVTVTVSKSNDGAIVAGPATTSITKLASSERCGCPSTQPATLEM